MATLIPTLTLSSTDATSDTLSFTVTDQLSITKKVITPSRVTTSTGDLTLFASSSYSSLFFHGTRHKILSLQLIQVLLY